MEAILFIDTSDNKKVSVSVIIDGKTDTITQETDKWKAQVVLPIAQQLLLRHKIAFSDLTKVAVNRGPGSFTGLRVGVSIANALATWLHIPINDKKIGEIEEPIYE